MNIIISW